MTIKELKEHYRKVANTIDDEAHAESYDPYKDDVYEVCTERVQRAATEVWDAIMEMLDMIPEWVPASNPPKKTCEDVLCYDEDGDVVMGYYVDEECGWYSKGAFRIFPTHWMPLPKGPDADVTAE